MDKCYYELNSCIWSKMRKMYVFSTWKNVLLNRNYFVIIIQILFLIKCFDTAIESHVIRRKNTERSQVLFTQFPLVGNILQNYAVISHLGYWCWHSQEAEHFHLHKDSLLLPFYNHACFLPLLSSLKWLSTAHLHFCHFFKFQERYLNIIYGSRII